MTTITGVGSILGLGLEAALTASLAGIATNEISHMAQKAKRRMKA